MRSYLQLHCSDGKATLWCYCPNRGGLMIVFVCHIEALIKPHSHSPGM